MALRVAGYFGGIDRSYLDKFLKSVNLVIILTLLKRRRDVGHLGLFVTAAAERQDKCTSSRDIELFVEPILPVRIGHRRGRRID